MAANVTRTGAPVADAQPLPEGIGWYETRPCPFCGEKSVLILAEADVIRSTMDYVQDVWSYQPADFRELLISGTHGTCWDEAFPEEDEDE